MPLTYCASHHRRPRKAVRRRRGFVLLLTLIWVALVAVLLAGLAQHGFRLASMATDTQQELQYRWGSQSLRRALVYRLKSVEDANIAGTAGGSAPALGSGISLRRTLHLGALTFEIQLDNEGAKVPLHRFIGNQGALATLDAWQSAGLVAADSLLRESAPLLAAGTKRWLPGQLFAQERATDPNQAATWLRNQMRDVTCWGAGRVNLKRLPPGLWEICGPIMVGDELASKVARVRQVQPTGTWEEWLVGLDLAPEERRRLEQWCGDTSDSYTVWISASAPGRSWAEMTAVEIGSSGPRLQRFVW